MPPIRRAVTVAQSNPENVGAIATFEVPGPKTILSNGAIHKVTVAELELDGELSWVSAPTKDVRMHWTGMTYNASEYLLLKGMLSIYINGRSYVGPQERFSCALGIDPSIRVVYHPRERKRSQTGFYSKSNNHIFTQRICIANNKSCAISNVKVIDHIPVSEESSISMKLVSPSLPLTDPSDKKKVDMSKSVHASRGVMAQWEKGDEDDIQKLSSESKLSWVCTIPAQDKLNSLLSWGIAAPVDISVVGL